MFEADAYVLDIIYSFLEDDEYALVNYQSLQRADPRKYERKSIFAAHAANRLGDPILRFLYSLPVDFRKIPKTTLISVYREEAFDAYVANGVCHPEMIERLMRIDPEVFRAAYPRGIKHYDTRIMSREYISLLSHPIRVVGDVVEAVDNGDTALAQWFVDRYNIRDVVVMPKRYETYVIFKDAAIIDYSLLDRLAIPRIIGGEHVYMCLSRRRDADTLEITWPRMPGILRNAVIHGHVNIVKRTLDHSKMMMTTAYQALTQTTLEVAKYVHDYHFPHLGSELCHEYFYEKAKKPLSRDAAVKAIKSFGVSEGAYRDYLIDGGDVYISTYAKTAHKYQCNFSKETMSHMCYHLLTMPADVLKDVRRIYDTRSMPSTVAEVFSSRGII